MEERKKRDISRGVGFTGEVMRELGLGGQQGAIMVGTNTHKSVERREAASTSGEGDSFGIAGRDTGLGTVGHSKLNSSLRPEQSPGGGGTELQEEVP